MGSLGMPIWHISVDTLHNAVVIEKTFSFATKITTRLQQEIQPWEDYSHWIDQTSISSDIVISLSNGVDSCCCEFWGSAAIFMTATISM